MMSSPAFVPSRSEHRTAPGQTRTSFALRPDVSNVDLTFEVCALVNGNLGGSNVSFHTAPVAQRGGLFRENVSLYSSAVAYFDIPRMHVATNHDSAFDYDGLVQEYDGAGVFPNDVDSIGFLNTSGEAS